jgi:ABC-type nickel/cobalt efflux system permease component RcnA
VRRSVSVAAVAALVVLWPAVASAHPLGNFTINLYSGIRLTPGQVRIDYVVDMAEIPTFQEMADIDANGDGRASDAERAAWADRQAPRLLANVSLSVDGRPVSLGLASSSMWFRPGQGGLPILRLETTFAGPIQATGALTYRDGNYPGRIGWREITASGGDGVALPRSSVPAGSVSDALLSYPQDLLSSPLHVTRATIAFAPGVSAPAAPAERASAGARPGVTGGAFAGLVSQTGLPLVALSILLAMAFGALHALGPGHGKTLMAAYLVGAGGRGRQAVAIGGAVAVMHTASVLALGLVVISAERWFPPERVYPWLGLASGLVALGLGSALLVSRLAAWTNAGRHGRDHGPGHAHGHAHAGPHSGDPGGPVLSRRGLAALAVAGGILPSPTALVVLLASIAFHRALFGLVLIAAFSLGLAGALMVVGILALRAREMVSRRMSSRLAPLLPALSASAILLVGLFLTVRGLAQL